MLSKKLEWAGCVLNSRLVWKEAEGKPEWVRDLDLLDENGDELDSPLSLLKNMLLLLSPLGNAGARFCCGGSVQKLVLIASSRQGKLHKPLAFCFAR